MESERAGRNTVTTELHYLLLTAILTGALWIPVVSGYVSARGPLKPADYKVAPTSPLPPWVHRANRAHLNGVESFAPFASAVLIGHAAGISNSVTVVSTIVFFWARLSHAVIHVTGFSMFRARTLVFTVGWSAFMTFAVDLLWSGV
jgi:uncharacterized MAPEG superfamily protein